MLKYIGDITLCDEKVQVLQGEDLTTYLWKQFNPSALPLYNLVDAVLEHWKKSNPGEEIVSFQLIMSAEGVVGIIILKKMEVNSMVIKA